MTTSARLIAALALTALIAGCGANVATRTDHRSGTDFSAYRTFTVQSQTGDVPATVGATILSEVGAQLAAKGLASSPNDGDLLVYSHVRQRTNTKVDVWETGGWGYGYARRVSNRSYVDIRTVPIGTLVIDLVDRNTSEAVWRGVAEGTIGMATSIEASDARIRAAIATLFIQYPPSN